MIANVDKPIIEVDFLNYFGLLVDVRNKKLIDSTTSLSAVGTLTRNTSPCSIKAVAGTSKYHRLLSQYPDIVRPTGRQREVKHNITHQINTTPGQPIFSRPRRLLADRLKIVKTEFDLLLQKGVIRP